MIQKILQSFECLLETSLACSILRNHSGSLATILILLGILIRTEALCLCFSISSASNPNWNQRGHSLKNTISIFNFSLVGCLSQICSYFIFNDLLAYSELSEKQTGISFVVSLWPLKWIKENSLESNGLLLFLTGPYKDPFLLHF